MDQCPEYVHCGCFLHLTFLHLSTEQIWDLNESHTSVWTERTFCKSEHVSGVTGVHVDRI